jgi:hypothetical protein
MRSVTTLTHRAPRQIIAGDSIEFLVAVPADYQLWTGSARLAGPGQMAATSVATEGSDFHVKFEGQSAGGTKALAAGQYVLTVWATSGNDRKTIAQFPLTVAVDLSTGTPAQPHAIEMLPIIEAAIKARITGNPDGGLAAYTIDGTSVTKIPLDELKRLRKQYAAEVAAIQNPNGQFGRVKFAMTSAGGIVDVRRRFGP